MLHKGTDTYFNIIKSSFSKILCLQGACQELSVLLLHCQVKHPSTWTIIQFCKTLQACKSQAQRYLSFLFTRLYWTFAEKSWLCAVWWSAHQKRRRPSSLWPLIHQDIQVLAEIIHFDRPCHRCSMGACPLFCTFGVSKKKCTKPKKAVFPTETLLWTNRAIFARNIRLQNYEILRNSW